MDLAEYIQSDETVAVQTETEGGLQGSGQLVATDSRLIFYQSNFFTDRIRDIPLHRVDQVEYRVQLFSPLLSFLAMISFLSAPLIFFVAPKSLLSDLNTPISILLIIFSVGFFLIAFLAPSERLVVKTPSASHTFEGGSLSEIPGAIRDHR